MNDLQLLSATFVVSLLKIFVSFEVELPQLYFPLSVFDNCVLYADFALFNVSHDFSQQPLEYLSHSSRFLNRNLVILALLRVLEGLYFTGQILQFVARRVDDTSAV